jgi:hypothetical protein
MVHCRWRYPRAGAILTRQHSMICRCVLSKIYWLGISHQFRYLYVPTIYSP